MLDALPHILPDSCFYPAHLFLRHLLLRPPLICGSKFCPFSLALTAAHFLFFLDFSPSIPLSTQLQTKPVVSCCSHILGLFIFHVPSLPIAIRILFSVGHTELLGSGIICITSIKSHTTSASPLSALAPWDGVGGRRPGTVTWGESAPTA